MPFNNVSDSDLVTKTAIVAQALTPERYAYLLSLLPTPTGFSELSTRLGASFSAALRGEPEGQEAFEADRQEVNRDLAVILGLARVVAAKDPTVPESLGLDTLTQKGPSSATPLGVPQNLKVVYEPNGDLLAGIGKVSGAKGYQVFACDGDPAADANWRLVASSNQTRGIVIEGLNRSKLNLLKVRAIRGKEFGPWSNWIALEPK